MYRYREAEGYVWSRRKVTSKAAIDINLVDDTGKSVVRKIVKIDWFMYFIGTYKARCNRSWENNVNDERR